MLVGNLHKAVLYRNTIDLLQSKRIAFVEELNAIINNSTFDGEQRDLLTGFRNRIVVAENAVLEEIYSKIKEL